MPVTRDAALALTAVLSAAAVAGAASYDLVPQRSDLLVRTDRAGFFGFLGHHHTIRARRFSGTIVLPNADGPGSLDVEIEADSLAVEDPGEDVGTLEKIRRTMDEEVLESAEYPRIALHSTSVRWAKDGDVELRVTGDLSLHGTTRALTFPIRVVRETDRLHLEGEVVVRQRDFGIRPVSVGVGAVQVKDEVVVTFVLVAVPSADEGDAP